MTSQCLDPDKGSGTEVLYFEEFDDHGEAFPGHYYGITMSPKPTIGGCAKAWQVIGLQLVPGESTDEWNFPGALHIGTGLNTFLTIKAHLLLQGFKFRLSVPDRQNLLVYVDGKWPKCRVNLHWRLAKKLGPA